MSSIKISPVDCGCSPSSFPSFSLPEKRRNPTEINSNTEKIPSKTSDNQFTFEVNSNLFNRKIEVKTKQEDTICSIKKPSPIITCSTTHQSTPSKSSSSNSSIQSVRISVSSSPYRNRMIEKTDEQTSIYSSVTSNYVQENVNKQPELDRKEDKSNISRRPLLDLINEINQNLRPTPLENTETDRKIFSLSPSKILPAKQFSPFRPVILRKKSQEPIGRFNLINTTKDSSSLNYSNGLINKTERFLNPIDIQTNGCDNCPRLANDSSLINSEHNSSSLSISGTSLPSTSNTNATPTTTTNIDDKNEAKRKAIALQMYDTEKSYVEALKNLVTKYYLPMKDKDIVSNDLINDIFYKIPEIHIHHTAFLISLSQKLSQWDNKQTVGDLLLQMFTRTSVIETYTSFVNNYKTAQIAIRLCRDFSSFNKFLEQQARDHRGKLTLRDLIIQPVQRIPRYELYIKDFLKCTNLNHPDYQLLLKAQSEIHSLAEQIDQVQKEVGSTDLTVSNNSLELVQDMIDNLNDLVIPNRYYIRHDIVTLQLSSGIKKDRCIFLFNDLIIITSSKRRSGTLSKKSNNSIIVNSPSGKQYIDNSKHKLIMKIPLESVDMTTDHLKKRRSSMSTFSSLRKSPSIASHVLDKQRQLEEDLLILGQISDLAKTLTTPHQQLDDSIKETLNNVNKHLIDDTTSLINLRRPSPECNNSISDFKGNHIQLLIQRTDSNEKIDMLFSSLENKIIWEKNFLEAKKVLVENSSERKPIRFEHVLPLPHHRPGSEFTCGTIRSFSNDLCLCNTEGEICLINMQSNIGMKSSSTITSSKINCIECIPSNKIFHPIKTTERRRRRRRRRSSKEERRSVDSLLDFNSSDEEEEQQQQQQEKISLNDYLIDSFENDLNNQQEDTIWIGTDHGGLFIYECSHTMKMFGRKNRIVKQLNSSIHSILHMDHQVFLALNHQQLCVFQRDINGRWDLDNPIMKIIEENSEKSSDQIIQSDNEENGDRITVMSLVQDKIWCGIRDRIFVVCPNSLDVQHSFIVDDYHRHICSIATSPSSIHHVWIASQDSHEIRLYHSNHFHCLLEFSIKTFVTQKLQGCDDIIRAHKLGCLRVTRLHVWKDILWIGTSAGLILNLTTSQLIDSLSTNKLSQNSIQLESLSFGHAGPVRFFLSNIHDETNQLEKVLISMGDGFEDFNNNEENFGKDDALSHLIFCKF